MYKFIRPLLFLLEPELAHELSLHLLNYVPSACFRKPETAPFERMGLTFPHHIGLAAGLDKNGEYLDALAKLGFAFIEIGTTTPRPQYGNPKPRLFRLPKAQALINRMGFNNQGVDRLVYHVQRAAYQGILGINIGKNKDTPLDRAVDDYIYCLEKVYPYASYITINISSPNTPDLRQLQQAQYFENLIQQLQQARKKLQDKHGRHVPLLIKLSPDEVDADLIHMTDVMMTHNIEGIIATNTTCDRKEVTHLPHGAETGGLSGAPLQQRSTSVLRLLKNHVGENMTLIGVGGIHDAVSAHEKLQAGADLLQIYTGLIYQGPRLISVAKI